MRPMISGVPQASNPLVLARTDDGFRIYAASDPSHIFHVTGQPHLWTCTCPDFRAGNGNGSQECAHIRAIQQHVSTPVVPHPGNALEPPRVTGHDERASDPDRAFPSGMAQMVLKRSVSPDGRIDSLSVEFACGVAQTSVGAIKAQALQTLQLQGAIVESFLNQRDSVETIVTDAPRPVPASDGSEAAELLHIGGMNGKWGRRLFITVQANGHTLKLFGNRQQLADAIVAAGFPERAQGIAEGVELRLPCRILTAPTADGRFRNITQVLPTGGNGRVQ